MIYFKPTKDQPGDDYIFVRVKQLDLRQEIPDTNVDVIVANLHVDLLVDLFKRRRSGRPS